MLKTEFKKIFHTKLLYVSVFLGCVSCLTGLLAYHEDVSFYRQTGKEAWVSAYQGWLYCLSMGSSVYRLVIPLLIVPCIDSCYLERTSGYMNFVVSRSGYARWFFSKWAAGIFSAALVIFMTLGISLAVCFGVYPANAPLEVNTYIHYPDMKAFYMNDPGQFIAMLYAANILFAVVYFTLGFATSCWAKNRYVIVFVPMIVYYVNLLVSQFLSFSPLSPIAIIAPYELLGLSVTPVLTVFGITVLSAAYLLLRCYRQVVTTLP